mmetsp:Transcript_13860/g.12281  ORF Transcript_13860/g.12281 Transcript_13860/m.12281 type:complete len:146 (+) Transcript_13860:290-727(+)
MNLVCINYNNFLNFSKYTEMGETYERAYTALKREYMNSTINSQWKTIILSEPGILYNLYELINDYENELNKELVLLGSHLLEDVVIDQIEDVSTRYIYVSTSFRAYSERGEQISGYIYPKISSSFLKLATNKYNISSGIISLVDF